MKKITIIIPAYNADPYLGICVDSVVAQTYKNLEIIIIDDGSTDGTAKLADELAELYNNIKVIHKPNGGVSSARNMALAAAEGEYIGFVDADDWIEPDMYELLAQAIELRGADLASCGVFYDAKDTEQYIIYKKTEVKPQISDINSPYRDIMLVPQISGYLCNKLFKKELVTGLFFEEKLAQNEDLLFVTEYLNSVTKMVNVEKRLYHYRMGSSAPSVEFSARTLTMISAYEKIYECYKNQAPEYAVLAEKNLLKIFLNFKGRLKLSGKKDEDLYMRIKAGIKAHIKPVLISKQISKYEKINIIFTAIFAKIMLKIKVKALTKRHQKGIWEE